MTYTVSSLEFQPRSAMYQQHATLGSMLNTKGMFIIVILVIIVIVTVIVIDVVITIHYFESLYL